MPNIIKDTLIKRIQWTHNNIISISEALTEERLAHQPGPTSPPIAWHLWHASRWSDRLQASFLIDSLEGTYQEALFDEIWKQENMAGEWDLHTKDLGLLETGATMNLPTATRIASFDKRILIGYARRTFCAVEEVISSLNDENLLKSRYSILPELQKNPGEKPNFVSDRKVTVFDDLLFHATHVGRHLGMMEALQGTLFEMPGSVTV